MGQVQPITCRQFFFKTLAKIFKQIITDPSAQQHDRVKFTVQFFSHTDSVTPIHFVLKTGQNILIFTMAMSFIYTKMY